MEDNTTKNDTSVPNIDTINTSTSSNLESNISIEFSIPSIWDTWKPMSIHVDETFGKLKKRIIYNSFSPLINRDNYFKRFEIQLYFIKDDNNFDKKQMYISPHNDEIITKVILREEKNFLGKILFVLVDLLPDIIDKDNINVRNKIHNILNSPCTEWITNTNIINDYSTSEYQYEHPSNLLTIPDEMLSEIMNAGILQGTLEKKIISQSGSIAWVKQYFILTVDRLWYIQEKQASYIELDFISTCELEEQPLNILGKSSIFSVSYGYSGPHPLTIRASSHLQALEWMKCLKNRYFYLEGDSTVGFDTDNSKLIQLEKSICEIEEHSCFFNMAKHSNIFKFNGLIKNNLLRKYFREFLENKFDNSQNSMKFWEYAEDYFRGHPHSLHPFIQEHVSNVMSESDLRLWSTAIYDTFLVKTSEFCIPPVLFKELQVEIQQLRNKIINNNDTSSTIFRSIQNKVMQYIMSTDYLDFLNKNRNIFLCVLTIIEAEENQTILEQLNKEELKRIALSTDKPIAKAGFTSLFDFPSFPTHRSNVIMYNSNKNENNNNNSPNKRNSFQKNRRNSIISIVKPNMPLPFWRLTVHSGNWISQEWWQFVEIDSIDMNFKADYNNNNTNSSDISKPIWAIEPTVDPKVFIKSIRDRDSSKDIKLNDDKINIIGLTVEESLRSFLNLQSSNINDDNESGIASKFAAVKREEAFIQPFQYINSTNLGKVLLTGFHQVKYLGKKKSNQTSFESYNTGSTEFNLNSSNSTESVQQYAVLSDRLGKGLISFYNPITFTLQAIIHLNCVKEICPTTILKNRCLNWIDISDVNGLCWQLYPEGIDEDDFQGVSRKWLQYMSVYCTHPNVKITTIIAYGNLLKRGDFFNKSYQRRWFILTNKRKILYYKVNKLKGEINLKLFILKPSSNSIFSTKDIVLQGGKSNNGRIYDLQTVGDEDMTRWRWIFENITAASFEEIEQEIKDGEAEAEQESESNRLDRNLSSNNYDSFFDDDNYGDGEISSEDENN